MTYTLIAVADLTIFGNRTAICGSARTPSGAVTPSSEDIQVMEDATSEWVQGTLRATLDRSKSRRQLVEASEQAAEDLFVALVTALGASSVQDVWAHGRSSTVYQYEADEYDVAAKGFVDGRSVLVRKSVVMVTQPTAAELARLACEALEKYEYHPSDSQRA